MSTSLTVDRFLTGNVMVLDYWVNQSGSPVITAVSQVQDGATFTVTGTGFSGSGGDTIILQQGDRTLELIPGADSTISITSPILDSSGFFKTQPVQVLVQNVGGVLSQPFNLPLNADGRTYIQPASGASAWPITLPVTAAPDKRLAFTPDLQQDMEVLVDTITGPGTSVSSVVVNPDGTFVVAADALGSPSVDSFRASGMDGTRVGDAAVQTILDAPTTVNVPLDLVGETFAQAASELAALGVNIHIQGYAQNALIPLGDIVSTFPGGGFPVNIGGTVEVILSLSTTETQVPNMIGEARSNAEADRSNAQLTGHSYPFVDGNNSGVIVGQSVAAQTLVAVGAPVDLAYSSNLPPDVRNLQVNQAIAQISASNLNFAVSYITGQGTPGYVQNQSPLNTPVNPGDVITVDVIQFAGGGEDDGGVGGAESLVLESPTPASLALQFRAVTVQTPLASKSIQQLSRWTLVRSPSTTGKVMKKLLLSLLFAPLLAFASQQVINVGSSPNDHTGDTLRNSWIKGNANFTELYGVNARIFRVKDYGAFSDGSNLSATTIGIQAAITAACANTHGTAKGGVVFLDPGQYASGPVIQPCPQVYIVGSGRGTTSISFTPTGNTNPTALASGVADPGTWLTVANSVFTSSQPTITYYAGIAHLSVFTSDLTTQKNAIYLAETSQYHMEDINIDHFWGNNSAGLRMAGHETTIVQDCFISGTVPVWINRGLVAYTGVRYNDNIQFIDVGTRAPHGSDPAGYYPSGIVGGVPLTNYLIDDGVFISNMTMDRMSWVGGANAVYWKQTINATSLSYNVKISNGRKEQSGGTNAPSPGAGDDPIIGLVFDFTGASQRLADIQVQNVLISGTHTDSGIYAHSVNTMTLNNFGDAGYTADGLFVFDVDNVFQIQVTNLNSASAGNPSTINFGANEGSARDCQYRQNVNIPINCTWTFESAPRIAKTLASGSQGNWVPSTDIGGGDFPRGIKILYFTTTAGAATLTGLPPPVNTTGLFTYGEFFDICVANGGNALTLPHNSGSETTAADRWENVGAEDTIVLPGQCRKARYDFTISRYMVQ